MGAQLHAKQQARVNAIVETSKMVRRRKRGFSDYTTNCVWLIAAFVSFSETLFISPKSVLKPLVPSDRR
jgi:hypothetical protein